MGNDGYLNLVINTSYCKLPGVESNYFYLEEKDGLNVEGGIMRNPFRRFVIKHPQSDDFLDSLGVENTKIFYDVMLSYYDASYMLFDFSKLIGDIDNVSLQEIEKHAIDHDLDLYNYRSVEEDNYLAIVREGPYGHEFHSEELWVETNHVQLLLWAMHLEDFLKNYGISYLRQCKFQ